MEGKTQRGDGVGDGGPWRRKGVLLRALPVLVARELCILTTLERPPDVSRGAAPLPPRSSATPPNRKASSPRLRYTVYPAFVPLSCRCCVVAVPCLDHPRTHGRRRRTVKPFAAPTPSTRRTRSTCELLDCILKPGTTTSSLPATPRHSLDLSQPRRNLLEPHDLPDGTYTLTQEGDGAVEGEVNELSVQQDLDQSPEEPKAVFESEEGNPIWPGSIPDGWELEWENDDEE